MKTSRSNTQHRLNLQDAFRLDRSACVVFVGAGGKTTAMFRLARDLKEVFGTTVLVTTTTHLADSQASLADRHLIVSKLEDLTSLDILSSEIILVSGPAKNAPDGKRLSQLSPDLLYRLQEFCKLHELPLLIEADGARMKPLKAPALHEPPIPDFAETVVLCAGLNGIGKSMNREFIHRAEYFKKIASLNDCDVVTAKAASQVMLAKDGGLKNIPHNARRIALLNQADNLLTQSIGQEIARNILGTFDIVVLTSFNISPISPTASNENFARTISEDYKIIPRNKPAPILDDNFLTEDRPALTSFNTAVESVQATKKGISDLPFTNTDPTSFDVMSNGFEGSASSSIRNDLTSFNISKDQASVSGTNLSISAVYQQIAGIVLAAGGSSRYGKPKQLLDYHGQPFVQVVAETALQAGLSPVVIVTGYCHEQIEQLFAGSHFQLVHNPQWIFGQSTSIKVGVASLSENVGAAIFLLADQPQIAPALIRTLKDSHATNPSPIIAPLVFDEHRGNPVLFDRSTFPDLMGLEGDEGGRSIFGRYRIKYIPWFDPTILIDIDTPEEYEKFIQQTA